MTDEVSGIFLIQNFFLLVGADMGVNLGGGDGAVPQNMLYIADIYILLEQLCRKGMPKHMRSKMLGDFQYFFITGN